VAWERAYLAHWREQALEIVLGGGRANGRLGHEIRDAAQEVLDQVGLERRLSLADYPSSLPLIGAARSVPLSGHSAAVVFDFGGSRAKRGIAAYDGSGALCRLHALPPRDVGHLTQAGKTAELGEAMVAIIVETMCAVETASHLAPTVVCSVAAYVEDGEPVRMDRGSYTWLHRLAPDIRAWFKARLGGHIGAEYGPQYGLQVGLEFVHDCDVAACALAGRPHAAVLMLGSGLCVGFVPPAEGYRPLAEGFALHQVQAV
jgi:hypothetical protein